MNLFIYLLINLASSFLSFSSDKFVFFEIDILLRRKYYKYHRFQASKKYTRLACNLTINICDKVEKFKKLKAILVKSSKMRRRFEFGF